MNYMISDELIPYIKYMRYDTIIPKENMPRKYQKKFKKEQQRYAIWNPYCNQHHCFIEQEKSGVIKYDCIPENLLKHIIIRNNTIEKKESFPNKMEQEFEFWRKYFEVDIAFFKYEKYYLVFSKKDKLSIWQKFNLKIGRRKCVVFC